jgi:hypothetical protein
MRVSTFNCPEFVHRDTAGLFVTGKQHLETDKGLTMRANAFSDEKTITINFVKKMLYESKLEILKVSCNYMDQLAFILLYMRTKKIICQAAKQIGIYLDRIQKSMTSLHIVLIL